ncbi:hypothetical protein AVEN_84647-1 [Araneus ventricosus]|uniref:Uncharacterized protein n=1 Tax=Araneus ventricosus TaxID=182803 RepID=A0A4Y2HKK1_ARAVE|nr:hypothetical protein AVEN_84647-1 [Araneus ventricosus]
MELEDEMFFSLLLRTKGTCLRLPACGAEFIFIPFPHAARYAYLITIKTSPGKAAGQSSAVLLRVVQALVLGMNNMTRRRGTPSRNAPLDTSSPDLLLHPRRQVASTL